MKIPMRMLQLGMVMHEDDDSIVLKFNKSDDTPIHLGESATEDKFFTVVCVRQTGNGNVVFWDPWKTA